MNVLMICQDVRIDRRIVLQAQSLSAAGYSVSILARAEASGLIPEGETDGGIPVRRIRVEGHDPRFRWLFALAGLAGRGGFETRPYAGGVAATKLWGAVSARNTFSVLAPP